MIDADQVAKHVHTFYAANIPANKRPLKTEWTNMAAILAYRRSEEFSVKHLKVLGLATGSKCLPEVELPTDGSLIHDSHAEVLARRCFMRFLYHEMKKVSLDDKYQSEILGPGGQPGKFRVKDGTEFLLYTSHTPCGDASIMPKKALKRPLADQPDTDDAKKAKLEDIHRTGAKCVPSSAVKDAKEKGVNYHVTGLVRTKPGRGESTKCMSCSDKIAKWLVLGIQGSLLSSLLERPVYLSAVIVGKCPFDEGSMRRALVDRSKGIPALGDYRLTEPVILNSTVHMFPDSKLAKLEGSSQAHLSDDDDDDESGPIKACPTSICWTKGVDKKPVFVLVKGNYQGVTKKSKGKSRVEISKSKFLDDYKQLAKKTAEAEAAQLTYGQAKAEAGDYAKAADAFYAVYSDWLRLDRAKYYNFQ